jgi:hypothetical protein
LDLTYVDSGSGYVFAELVQELNRRSEEIDSSVRYDEDRHGQILLVGIVGCHGVISHHLSGWGLTGNLTNNLTDQWVEPGIKIRKFIGSDKYGEIGTDPELKPGEISPSAAINGKVTLLAQASIQ